MTPHAQMEMDMPEQEGTQVPLGRLGELVLVGRVAVEETLEMALLRGVGLTVDAVMEIQGL
jgi:hypothetical protein